MLILLLAAASMYGDLTARFHIARFLMPPPDHEERHLRTDAARDSGARVILTAHHDAPRTGCCGSGAAAPACHGAGRADCSAALAGPLHFFFWTVMAALVAALARLGLGESDVARRWSSSCSPPCCSPT